MADLSPQKDAPAFDFYPERWLVGVAQFSDAEQLSYLRLLCHQWIMDGLPVDIAALRRLAGRGVTEALLEKFPVVEGKRRNAMLERLRIEQRDRINEAREKSQRMNAVRWRQGLHKDSTRTPARTPQGQHKDASKDSLELPSPPTTVQTYIQPQAPQACPAPCTESDAWGYAQSAGIAMTREGVTLWHSVNERNGWTIARGNGAMQPITDWRAALRSSVPWVTAELSKSKRHEPNNRKHSGSSQPEALRPRGPVAPKTGRV